MGIFLLSGKLNTISSLGLYLMSVLLRTILLSCLAVYGHPPDSTKPNFGAAVTIHVDGIFYRAMDTGGQQFRDILKVQKLKE